MAVTRLPRAMLIDMGRVDDDVAPMYPSTQMVSIAHAPEAGAYRGTVETTIGMMADHPRPFALESPIALMPITNPNPARFRRTYRARSAVLTADEWSLVDGFDEPSFYSFVTSVNPTGCIGKFSKKYVRGASCFDDMTKHHVSHCLHRGKDKKRMWKVVPK